MLNNAILIMDLEHPSHKITLEYVDETALPEYINGESGFHIYHVRMLTEQILRQLSEKTNHTFSEEEILAVAAASALHDIGKTKIPESILKYPGRLSSVEYDIVKKHTLFGEEMIETADISEIDPKLAAYAKRIVRSHHERFDGTGYPDGLSGAQIPVWAQAVALADAYDALTSKRHYKQAYSQDVAVQMLVDGMSGVFQEELIQALVRAVDHHAIQTLREQFEQARVVTEAVESHAPKCVFCVGNTGYLDQSFIEEAFPESKVILWGEENSKYSDRIKSFRKKESSIPEAFETYEFDAVVYFSRELTYNSKEASDAETLKEVLQCAADVQKEIRFLYFSSLEALQQTQKERVILIKAKEKLCECYGEQSNLDVKIIRLPYLYSGSYEKDFLFQMFREISAGKTVNLKENPYNSLIFLSMQDLAELCERLFDNWKSGGGILNVTDAFHQTFSDFRKKAEEIPKAKIRFQGNVQETAVTADNQVLRRQYGWFAKVSLLDELFEEYEQYCTKNQQKERTFVEKVKAFAKKYASVVKTVELLLLFVLTECLVHHTDSAVIFSVVDFRMAYIVIMAITYGLPYGIAAASLSSFAWIAAKWMTGTSMITIFYEPTNWLAIVYFFLIGALCGYVKIRSADQIRFTTEEKKLLEEKLAFTKEIYEDTCKEKRSLKKQILGSKDSFGKIFDITKNLDTAEPHLLYMQIIETFENVLENKNISVYSVNEEHTFGRLEAASRELIADIPRSISLDTYALPLQEIEKGNIWKNTDLTADLPMFGAGVYQEEHLALLIFIWDAEIEQQTLYYVNLFKILKDLAQMSLLRAFKYNEAIRHEKYIPDTAILTAEAFTEALENYRQLAQRKISSYLLLEVETSGRTLQENYALLKRAVRSNDLLGLREDGRLCLILTQAGPENLDIILPRLEKLGLRVSVLQS